MNIFNKRNKKLQAMPQETQKKNFKNFKSPEGKLTLVTPICSSITFDTTLAYSLELLYSNLKQSSQFIQNVGYLDR